MKFEWDENKNIINIQKHNVFFEEAITVLKTLKLLCFMMKSIPKQKIDLIS